MSGLIFHLIPHTHWDREWYLPRAAFQARLVPALDDVLERLTADPGYRSFLLDGQTVLVADYLRARPDREPELKTLVKTGRLQVGPWYVLADELIPSGEALVRNLLLGAADAEHWGARLDVLYSPDAFGHPAILPTLAREFGLRLGVVWRGLGGERGQERDLYRWCGPDGKEILLWHLPPQGYEIGAALPANGNRLPAAWATVREALVVRAAGPHIPVFVGADHHAAHPDLPRLRDLLAELEPASAFRVSRLDEFFQAAAETVKPAPPVVAGELRWSYRYAWTLQGVHGTRAPLKRRNAELELWLERVAEPLSARARRRRRGGRHAVPARRDRGRAIGEEAASGGRVPAVRAACARRTPAAGAGARSPPRPRAARRHATLPRPGRGGPRAHRVSGRVRFRARPRDARPRSAGAALAPPGTGSARPLARQPIRGGGARAERRAGAAGPAHGGALLRPAPPRRWRRRGGHLHVLPAGPRPGSAGDGADQSPPARGGPARRGARGPAGPAGGPGPRAGRGGAARPHSPRSPPPPDRQS